MKTIRLAEHADFLSTRFLGEIVRKEIIDYLGLHPVVTLDFQGVSGLSHSFADECFGFLVAENGIGLFKDRLRFANLNPEIQAILRFVLADRLGAASAA
ncbi:MAG: STAS-like domain-containing protein [Deltaproteobacteria bacterium]